MSLSLIHISDIHIEDSDDLIFSRVEKIKSACVSVLPHNETVLIVVSGDIANKGKKEQYSLAKIFFDDLIDSIKEKTNSTVFIVFAPGNHDCELIPESSVRNLLISNIKNTCIDQELFSNVVNVQKNYFEFVNQYGKYDLEKVVNKRIIEIGGNSFLVVVVNTAWMSVLHENPGNIIIPNNMLSEESIESNDFKFVFYVFHHPTNWLNPDRKREFVNHIRETTDFLLVGHEHERDSYSTIGDSFSFLTSHGKELQDRESSSSAFSVYLFDESFQNYTVFDFVWDKEKYIRENKKNNQLHKNIFVHQSVYNPNQSIVDYCEDIGISINHFAKDDVKLSDLFVCPDAYRYTYGKKSDKCIPIRENTLQILTENRINVIIGASSEGKTSLSKFIFLTEESKNNCCVLFDGSDFTSSKQDSIEKIIDNKYVQQYSSDYLEDFWQLPTEEKIIIIDNFDFIKNNNDRRNIVLDYCSEHFGKVIIFLSSDLELTSIIKSKTITTFEPFNYFELLPLGNRNRKRIISKWYHLNNHTQTEDEINERIEKAHNHITSFLGESAAFIPAIPLFVLSTLQNIDANKAIYDTSKFSFLYESLIKGSIIKSAGGDYDTGRFDMDSSALSFLAFDMIKKKKTCFAKSQLDDSVDFMNKKYILDESPENLLKRMINAKIIYQDLSEGECYRFKYPYIFYYFAGMYIAEHLTDDEVKEKVQYMSSRLYNETYGNTMIFVCHFANSQEVIDTILLSAYSTLEGYSEFEFTKTNPVFDEIEDSLQMLVPKSISDNSEVSQNQDESLKRKDEAGITDGRVKKEEDYIDDEIMEKERDMAEVSSAFKTMEVLGQILKNYPTKVDGQDKLAIIDEIHRLGMRSVEILVKTLIEYKADLVEYIYYKALQEGRPVQKEKLIRSIRRFINALVSGTTRGMIHQVAKSIDNEHLLQAATQSLSQNKAISAKLVLLDLKLNCLKKCDYNEIRDLRKVFTESNESFATCILDSIVGEYLNYNKCDVRLRAKLCSLCDFSTQSALLESHKNLGIQ